MCQSVLTNGNSVLFMTAKRSARKLLDLFTDQSTNALQACMPLFSVRYMQKVDFSTSLLEYSHRWR